jgi:Mn2+/Fe2+ NRAMP family transporter
MEFIANLFPYLHLAILIAGVFLLVFVKRKYPKVRNFELIIVFILFFILVVIFTEPGLDLLKRLILYIQI